MNFGGRHRKDVHGKTEKYLIISVERAVRFKLNFDRLVQRQTKSSGDPNYFSND